MAVCVAVPLLVWALEAGPDPGKCGAPGESTCAEAGCHTGTALNAGGGRVEIILAGSTYAPGVKQRISVRVSDPTALRWGFQLTARLSSNSRTQAGSLANVDANTMVICSNAALLEGPCNSATLLQFVEHTKPGTRPGTRTSATFDFDWTPPATNVGNIILYAAGNGANNNVQNTGDHIYTTTATLTPGAASTKPAISQNGVVNGGSFRTGIAFNTWVTILGSNLATNTRIWEGRDFVGDNLPTQLDGTSVKINNKDAFVYFISPGQLNVLAPVDATEGPVQVQVSAGGGTSDPATATAQKYSPAFFIFNNDKYIAATHANGSLLGPTTLFPGATTPARPEEVITLYGTGFGETSPAIPNGKIIPGPATCVVRPTIRMGTVPMDVSFAGQSATGLYQFNVRVPADAPNGDQAVVAEIGGLTSAPNTFITVQR